MPAAVDSIDQQVALMKLAARTIAALQEGKSKKVPKLVKRALLGYSHQIGKLLTINCKGSSTNFKRELYWAMLTSASENWCQQLNQKTGRCLKQQHILRQLTNKNKNTPKTIYSVFGLVSLSWSSVCVCTSEKLENVLSILKIRGQMSSLWGSHAHIIPCAYLIWSKRVICAYGVRRRGTDITTSGISILWCPQPSGPPSPESPLSPIMH